MMEVSLYPPATLVPDGAGLASQTARESSSYQHAALGQDESEAWLEDTGQQHHHPPESYVQQQQQQRVREGASVPSGHGQPQPGLQPRVEIDWNGTVKARVPVAGTIARTGGSIAQPSLYEAQSTAIHASRSGQPEAVGPSSAAQRLQKTLSGQHDKQTQQPRPAPQQPAPQAQSVPADGRAEYARENTLPGMYDRRAQTRVKASVGGPGLVLGQVEGKVVVLGLIPHLPAALSGVIQVNDEITEVDSFGIEQYRGPSTHGREPCPVHRLSAEVDACAQAREGWPGSCSPAGRGWRQASARARWWACRWQPAWDTCTSRTRWPTAT